jgi:hypothetical protein
MIQRGRSFLLSSTRSLPHRGRHIGAPPRSLSHSSDDHRPDHHRPQVARAGARWAAATHLWTLRTPARPRVTPIGRGIPVNIPTASESTSVASTIPTVRSHRHARTHAGLIRMLPLRITSWFSSARPNTERSASSVIGVSQSQSLMAVNGDPGTRRGHSRMPSPVSRGYGVAEPPRVLSSGWRKRRAFIPALRRRCRRRLDRVGPRCWPNCHAGIRKYAYASA